MFRNKHNFNKLGLLTLLLTQTIYASSITCPSVDDIKRGAFNYWLPLYIENEELASDLDVAKFQTHILEFTMARWDASYLENGHCFYRGNDPILQKIILAHDAWRPETSSVWQWKTANKLAECLSPDVTQCRFIQ